MHDPRLRILRFVPAVAFFLTVVSPAPAAAEPGSFWTLFETVQSVRTGFNSETASIYLTAPLAGPATITWSNWPASAPALPADLDELWIRFSLLTISPDEVDRALASCEKSAFIAQADPQKYNFRIFVNLPDAGTLVEVSEGRYRLEASAGYAIQCKLSAAS